MEKRKPNTPTGIEFPLGLKMACIAHASPQMRKQIYFSPFDKKLELRLPRAKKKAPSKGGQEKVSYAFSAAATCVATVVTDVATGALDERHRHATGALPT